MMTPISPSSRARSKACFISLTVSGRKALRTSGRLMVILAMPSSVRSNLMSVNSCMVVHIGRDCMLASFMRPIDVYKFGGVAVGSAEALRIAAAHVGRALSPSGRVKNPSHIVVVVSAMNGVTDLLLGAARAALARNRDAFESAAAEFESRHVALAREVLKRPQR